MTEKNSTVNFSLEEQQLDKIIEGFKPEKSKPKFNIDNLFTLIQIISLLISACWIFYKYNDHEEANAKLTNENLQLQKDNLKLQNNLHKELDLYTVRLSMLDIEKSKQDSALKVVDIRYRERLAKIEYNSRKLDDQSKAIDLKYAEALTKLEVERNRILFKRDSATYVKEVDNRYEFVGALTCKLVDSAKKLYAATLKAEIKNISDKEFNISATVLGLYLTKFELAPTNAPHFSMDILSPPPDVYRPYKSNKWTLIQQKAFLCWDYKQSFFQKLTSYVDINKYPPITSGMLTGRLKSGGKAFTNYHFFFTSDIDNVIGINLEVIFNDSFSDSYHFDGWRILKYLQYSPDN